MLCMSKQDSSVAFVCWPWELLRERIGCHVVSRASCECDYAISHVFSECMHAHVDVLGPAFVGGVLADHDTGLVVFVERRRSSFGQRDSCKDAS